MNIKNVKTVFKPFLNFREFGLILHLMAEHCIISLRQNKNFALLPPASHEVILTCNCYFMFLFHD